MKKIWCLSIIVPIVFCQSIAFVNASETEMSDNDFTQLVCGYLQKIDNKSEALSQIKEVTESKINDNQLAKLDEIAKSAQATKDFCSSSRPRL